jgi:hypothetical protein
MRKIIPFLILHFLLPHSFSEPAKNECALLGKLGDTTDAYSKNLKITRKELAKLRAKLKNLPKPSNEKIKKNESVKETLSRIWNEPDPNQEKELQKAISEKEAEEKELIKQSEKIVAVRAPVNKKEWDSLTVPQRNEYLKDLFPYNAESGDLNGIDLVVTRLKDWHQKPKDPFLQKILDRAIEEAGDRPTADGIQATVGEPTVKLYKYHLKDGTVIGGMVEMYQEGAERRKIDDNGAHFKTLKAAKAAGYTENDINWSCDNIFNEKGNLIEGGLRPRWEWSGN